MMRAHDLVCCIGWRKTRALTPCSRAQLHNEPSSERLCEMTHRAGYVLQNPTTPCCSRVSAFRV